ncbi:hypothetical protein JCM11641_001115 [Rhodosporidiobolus odoratus]
MSTPPMAVLSFGNVQPVKDTDLPAFPTTLSPANTASADMMPSSSQASTSSSTGTPPIDLQHVARAVLKAKRVAVVCGAGISTASGIPDFRSGAGLFKSLKEQHPDARLTSGKDLFDVGLFASESNAAIFYNMIAELKKQTDACEPTTFHTWLKELDDDGKLFRVYTQNIDALEEKAGLTYGLGDPSLPLPPRRAARSPSKPRAPASTSATATPVPSSAALQATSSHASCASNDSSSSYPTPRPSPSPPPPTHSTIPRVIPLHGHLLTLSCSACKHVSPTTSHLPLLASGSAPICPQCRENEAVRTAAGGRSRGVGLLRPDVVLYGEEHKDGERVGEITRRDLMGARPDLLIVVGTTLKVKGTKRLVRELAKVTKPLPKEPEFQQPSSLSTSSSSSTRSSAAAAAAAASVSTSTFQIKRRTKPPPVHTIYLNYDFPTPSRDWAGLFDVWARGDIQAFVEAVRRERELVRAEEEEKAARKAARMSGSAAGSSGKSVGTAAGNSSLGAAGGGGVKNARVGGAKVVTKAAGTTAQPPAPPPPPPSAPVNKFATVPRGPRPPPKDRSLPSIPNVVPSKTFLANTSLPSLSSQTVPEGLATGSIKPFGGSQLFSLPTVPQSGILPPSTSTSTSTSTSIATFLATWTPTLEGVPLPPLPLPLPDTSPASASASASSPRGGGKEQSARRRLRRAPSPAAPCTLVPGGRGGYTSDSSLTSIGTRYDSEDHGEDDDGGSIENEDENLDEGSRLSRDSKEPEMGKEKRKRPATPTARARRGSSSSSSSYSSTTTSSAAASGLPTVAATMVTDGRGSKRRRGMSTRRSSVLPDSQEEGDAEEDADEVQEPPAKKQRQQQKQKKAAAAPKTSNPISRSTRRRSSGSPALSHSSASATGMKTRRRSSLVNVSTPSTSASASKAKKPAVAQSLGFGASKKGVGAVGKGKGKGKEEKEEMQGRRLSPRLGGVGSAGGGEKNRKGKGKGRK